MKRGGDSAFSAKRAFFRFGVLLLLALALQGIPFLYTLVEGDRGVALYLIHLYALIPLCAVLAPFWAGKGGVHPLAAFFPVGGALLLLPVYESPGMGLLCLVLSLIAAEAGREWSRRKQQKGGRHGTGKAAKKS